MRVQIINFSFSSVIASILCGIMSWGIILCAIILCMDFSAYAFEEEQCVIKTEKNCVDFSERIFDGLPVLQCWKYEQKWICESKLQNNCEVLELNRGCRESASGCLGTNVFDHCQDFVMKFVCGIEYDENAQIKYLVQHLDQQQSLEQETDEKNIKNTTKVKNITNIKISSGCIGSIVDECSVFKNHKSCKEISRKCLYNNRKTEQCEHHEVMFECQEKQVVKKDCLQQNLCIGDICKSNPRSQHRDFGNSISYLNILAGMKSNELEGCRCPNGKATCSPNDIDTRNCKFFTGHSGICRIYSIFGIDDQFDCCADEGIIPDLFSCKEHEVDLHHKKQAGLCHHVGSWERDKALRTVEEQFKSSCCFNSKMARIIQVEGRKQLDIGWGNKENPDCRALTLDELKRIDFTKIDFGELFKEFEEKSKASIDTKKAGMQQDISTFKANPGQELINKKIQDFYGKRGN